MKIIKEVDKNPYTIMCFGDIHGNLQALEALMEERKKLDLDMTICLGDSITKGPFNNECLDILRKSDVTCLIGNNEYFMLHEPDIKSKTPLEMAHLKWVKESLSKENIEFIKKMPEKLIIKYKEKEMQFAHFLYGSKDEFLNLKYLYLHGIDDRIVKYNPSNYVFYGHKHSPGLDLFDGKSFVSVGSSGCTHKRNTYYVLLKYDHGHMRFEEVKVKYKYGEFNKALRNAKYPNIDEYRKYHFNIKKTTKK